MHPRWCRIFPSTIRRLLGWEAAANFISNLWVWSLDLLGCPVKGYGHSGMSGWDIGVWSCQFHREKIGEKKPKEAALLEDFDLWIQNPIFLQWFAIKLFDAKISNSAFLKFLVQISHLFCLRKISCCRRAVCRMCPNSHAGSFNHHRPGCGWGMWLSATGLCFFQSWRSYVLRCTVYICVIDAIIDRKSEVSSTISSHV